jgi:PAS domain S-box-containing protein
VTKASRPSLNKLRKKAEKTLEKNPAGDSRALPGQDVQSLTHELSVHQIELEMQNEELQRDQRELEAAREKYFDLYNLAPVAYLTFNDKGLVAEANLTAFSLLGVDRAYLINKSFSAFIDQASQDIFYHHRREVFRTGRKLTCELVLKRKDGTLFPAELQSIPLLAGERPVMRTILTDITGRRQAEEERTRLEEKLRQSQKMEAIGTLAGGIAHDFNNILAAIIGFTELSIDDAPEGSLIKRNMANVLKAGIRGRDLVKQVLAFSRKSEPKRSVFRLTPLVQETFNLLRATTPSTVAMELHTQATSDQVVAEPTEISQLIMNLCANATHAMREHGGLLEITLRDCAFHPEQYPSPHPNLAPGAYLELSVKDNGCGMSAATQDRIFEPFFTTKERGQGTGLGLAMVHGIVESLGGSITVLSEPGRGSTFRVFLPKVASDEQAGPHVVTEVTGGKERLLFVDDDELLVEAASEMLGRLGYEVIATRDPAEALRIFSEEPDRFHCVITDYTMPKATGVELAEDLMRIRPDIPIILCTGHSEMISRDEAHALGIREFAMKPLVKRELAETIRRALDTQTD